MKIVYGFQLRGCVRKRDRGGGGFDGSRRSGLGMREDQKEGCATRGRAFSEARRGRVVEYDRCARDGWRRRQDSQIFLVGQKALEGAIISFLVIFLVSTPDEMLNLESRRCLGGRKSLLCQPAPSDARAVIASTCSQQPHVVICLYISRDRQEKCDSLVL